MAAPFQIIGILGGSSSAEAFFIAAVVGAVVGREFASFWPKKTRTNMGRRLNPSSEASWADLDGA